MITIDEAVQKMNEGQAKRKDVAEEMGISPTTLTRQIKTAGYEYDQVEKRYKKIDISEMEEKEKTKIGMGSENMKNNEKQKVQLTEEEILQLKRMLEQRDKNEMYLLLQDIPNEDTSKKSILVTETTYKQFEEFSGSMKHISKNQLIELALIDFMKRYR